MFVCRDSACEIFVKGNGVFCIESDKCGVYICRDGESDLEYCEIIVKGNGLFVLRVISVVFM